MELIVNCILGWLMERFRDKKRGYTWFFLISKGFMIEHACRSSAGLYSRNKRLWHYIVVEVALSKHVRKLMA